MQIYFTTSDKPLSKLICHITGEKVSHCVIQWQGLIIHANLLGVQITTKEHFLKSGNRIIETITISPTWSEIKTMLGHVGKAYDFGALMYLGLRAFLPFLPKANLWNSTGMFLCTEFVESVLGEPVDAMITPHKLYLKLRAKNKK